MAKYYVTCGSVNMILDRETSRDAALDTCRCIALNDDVLGLSSILKVSEMGYEAVHGEDVVFWTEDLLADAGVSGDFIAF